MIRFECDYAEGAAPQLLERLTRTNLEQTPGYAVDGHCQRARDLIRAASDGEGMTPHRVGVADERGEVAALWNGRPQLEVGLDRTCKSSRNIKYINVIFEIFNDL